MSSTDLAFAGAVAGAALGAGLSTIGGYLAQRALQTRINRSRLLADGIGPLLEAIGRYQGTPSDVTRSEVQRAAIRYRDMAVAASRSDAARAHAIFDDVYEMTHMSTSPHKAEGPSGGLSIVVPEFFEPANALLVRVDEHGRRLAFKLAPPSRIRHALAKERKNPGRVWGRLKKS